MNADDASQSADMSPLGGRKGTPECEEESEKGVPLDTVDFILVTNIPAKTYRFKWILPQFSLLSTGTVLFSTGIHPLGSAWCRLKLVKYEAGFGLFHVNKLPSRQSYPEKNKMLPATNIFRQTNRECEEEEFYDEKQIDNISTVKKEKVEDRELSPVENAIHSQLEYLVTAKDINGKEWARWSVILPNPNTDGDTIIGKLFNTSNNFSSGSLVLDCCLKVTMTPTTEEQSFSDNPTLSCQGWKNLSRDLKTFYQNALNSDVTLLVRSDPLRAHKSILSARSPVFKKMFHHGMQECDRNTVDITDVPMDALRRLVEYLYTGVIEDASIGFQDLCDLYYAADKYEVADLRIKCGNTLLSSVAADTAMQILQLADSHSDRDLKSGALEFIRLNLESVTSTDAWESCTKSAPNLAAQVLNFCAKEHSAN
ncbi:TD and POZ domain-containing protein 4 [Caerostris darwini]|uniref:TD and POZ domain-containing protein 4 n=1 Tax=Caerostris darwini TaxID=1538125 RepID=A0AAV4MT07_9ARAC|nr:TD and POZ domain-containing protein 4 [Caerostris darwini]